MYYCKARHTQQLRLQFTGYIYLIITFIGTQILVLLVFTQNSSRAELRLKISAAARSSILCEGVCVCVSV